jgi:23S rRNA (guanosine2251-2'-O)-methyltransferase
MAIVVGIHPVSEALRAGRALDRVLIARGAGGARIQEIVDSCRKLDVPVRFEPREALERMAAGAVHQGVIGVGAARGYASLDEVAGEARLLVLLDGVEDPHNLGAVIRTANAVGAAAVLIPERRAAGLTETVAKASAGAIEYTPVVRVPNAARALEELKEEGFWIYGLDERGTVSYDAVDWANKAVVVLGAEGKGLHELVRKRCDVLVNIPMAGRVASLNVSVAAGVVLFDWRRKMAALPDPS